VIDNSQRHSETQASANIITSSLRFIAAMARVFAWLLAAATKPVRHQHIVDERAAPRVKR
jgi:hypothetical protein